MYNMYKAYSLAWRRFVSLYAVASDARPMGVGAAVACTDWLALWQAPTSILVGNLERKRPLGKCTCKWVDSNLFILVVYLVTLSVKKSKVVPVPN
jgi:hypothetical protein